jgi:hypothetical protein
VTGGGMGVSGGFVGHGVWRRTDFDADSGRVAAGDGVETNAALSVFPSGMFSY